MLINKIKNYKLYILPTAKCLAYGKRQLVSPCDTRTQRHSFKYLTVFIIIMFNCWLFKIIKNIIFFFYTYFDLVIKICYSCFIYVLYKN